MMISPSKCTLNSQTRRHHHDLGLKVFLPELQLRSDSIPAVARMSFCIACVPSACILRGRVCTAFSLIIPKRISDQTQKNKSKLYSPKGLLGLYCGNQEVERGYERDNEKNF